MFSDFELCENAAPVKVKHRTLLYKMRDGVEAELAQIHSELVFWHAEQSDCATLQSDFIKPNGSARLCCHYRSTLNA